MSRNRLVVLSLGALAGAVAIVVGATMTVSRYLSSHEATAAGSVSCNRLGAKHTVVIQSDTVLPWHTAGKLCDTLVIINKDTTLRLIAFGPHEDHQPYDGITEQTVGKNEYVKVTLNQLGTYHFHDHIHDEVNGDFTVTR